MNSRFKELLSALNTSDLHPVKELDLVEALHLISAHHSLVAICKALVRFFNLLEQFPDMTNGIPDKKEQSLKILRAITRLQGLERHFWASTADEASTLHTVPFTGDSPICDVLLIRPMNSDDYDAYEKLIAWFTWFSLQSHAGYLDFETYQKYILSDDGKPRLNKSIEGGRMYKASLSVKSYPEPDQIDNLYRILKFGLKFDLNEGRYLALLVALASGSNKKQTEQELKDFPNKSIDADRAAVVPALLGDLCLAIRGYWVPHSIGERRQHRWSRGASTKSKLPNSSVRAYGLNDAFATEIDGVIIVDVWPAEDDHPPPKQPNNSAEDLSPYLEDLPPRKPKYQFVLGSHEDLTRGYYLARTKGQAIERENALLRWTKDTLSKNAILTLISGIGPSDVDSQDTHSAKVLVGLSLITGRPLTSLMDTEFIGRRYNRKSTPNVQIDKARQRILVLAATPKLNERTRKKYKDSEVIETKVERVEIRLPSFMRRLLEDEKKIGKNLLSSNNVISAARSLIKSFPSHWGLTEKTIRHSIKLALLDHSNGDIGLVKIITDAQGLNFNTIVHYASYDISEACLSWIEAIESVTGDYYVDGFQPEYGRLEEPDPGWSVGTPDSINPDILRNEIGKVKSKLEKQLADKNWIPFFNLFTLYTLLWTNLALASRGRVNAAPTAIVGSRALVSDKHRDDDSTERLVPLTEGFQEQLKCYSNYVWHIALQNPQLQSFAESLSNGILRFAFIDKNGKVINFRPKWLYESEDIIPLQSNWARKFVQAHMKDIGGRFLNAGMGHASQGRYPHRLTSNFSSAEFEKAWVNGQLRIEKVLGFDLVCHPDFTETTVPWPRATKLHPPSGYIPEPKRKAIPFSDEEICAEFIRHSSTDYELINEAELPYPEDVLQLLIVTCGELAEDPEREYQFAKDASAYARRNWGTGVFAADTRPIFQKDWMLRRNALVNLQYLEQAMLPNFYKELARLPRVESDYHQLARFLMILVWRQGLTSRHVIKSFIDGFLESGIQSIAEIRYVAVTIRCKRGGKMMDRSIYLERYTHLYLAIEYERLKPLLGALQPLSRREFWTKCERLVKAYVKALSSTTDKDLFKIILESALQYHLINGVPVLAAYAAGEIETHDLPPHEIRRMLNLEPREDSKARPEEFNQSGGLEGRYQEELPTEELDDETNFVRHLLLLYADKTVRPEDMDDVALRTNMLQRLYCGDSRRNLLVEFALWLHKKKLIKFKGKFQKSEINRYQRHIEVIGYSVLGLSNVEQSADHLQVDEDFVSGLEESFGEQYESVDSSPAFSLFREFLRYRPNVTSLKKLFIDVTSVHKGQTQGVISKVILPHQQEEVRRRLASATSGIGDVATREAALREFDLCRIYGLRRKEALGLRGKDVQPDQIRVQEYPGQTLKTRAATRTMPTGFWPSHLEFFLGEVESDSSGQVVSPDKQIDGSAFFDATNKLIQDVTEDAETHLHILRHTLASQLFLSAVQSPEQLAGVIELFPWLADFVISERRLKALLGEEGRSGHGLQQISTLLGHLHPTTTLKHYIHTAGIAHLAYLMSLPSIDLDGAFEYRTLRPSNYRNRKRKWREETEGFSGAERQRYIASILREIVDPSTEQVGDFPPPYSAGGIDTSKLDAVNDNYFDRIKTLDSFFRGAGCNDNYEDLDAIRETLWEMSQLTADRKGKSVERHPLILTDSLPLPKELPNRKPTIAAVSFCSYLADLRVEQPEVFRWLLIVWLRQASRTRAQVTLTGDDIAKWEALPSSKWVKPKIQDASKGTGSATRHGSFEILENKVGSAFRQGSSAVRWAMTWSCVLHPQLLSFPKR